MRGLEFASYLASLGVPIFCGRLLGDGNPDTSDRRWDNWQKTRPASSDRNLARYREGDAVCAVGGWVLDFADYDPRNDVDGSGRTWLRTALNGVRPVTRSVTPSGGLHAGIPSLGLPKGAVLAGVDYQGGRPDGTSRGFVFIEPTERPSKETGEILPYQSEIIRSSGWSAEEFSLFRGAIEAARSNGHGLVVVPGGRQKPSVLRNECLTALPGAQRGALLRIIKEWQYRGYDLEDIFNLFVQLVGEMPCYDKANPWYPSRGNPEGAFRSLLKQAGTFVADARPGELDGIYDVEGIRSGGSGIVGTYADVRQRKVTWLIPGWLARGEMTITDGEKASGKSLVLGDIVARLSRGEGLPGAGGGTGEVFSTIIFTTESAEDIEVGPRLQAAGADMTRVFRSLVPVVRGKAPVPLLLPDGAPEIGKRVRASGASLAVFDPINDFLDESINTNNDASVRRALVPLAKVLRECGCAGWLIRHMNKNAGMDAKFRGTGASAYQNIARVHTVAARIDSGWDGDGRYALSMVDANLTRREDRALLYDIIDSSIELDDEGHYVARVEWYGWTSELDANDVSRGGSRGRGPVPVRRAEVVELLSLMFRESSVWGVPDANRRIRDEFELPDGGGMPNHKTIEAALRVVGVRKYQDSAGHWWSVK